MRNNGCWPFHHGQVLVDQESDEEDNSDIVRRQWGIPGASGLQGRTRPTPKEASKAIIEEHDELIAPKADLSNFSAYDSEDEPFGSHYIEDPYVPDSKSN